MTDDTHRFYGAWQAISGTLAGEAMPEEIVAGTELEIDDGKYQLNLNGNLDSGLCEINQQSEIVTMTIKGLKGPNEGKTILAIAELTSKDVLRIAYDLSGTKFPDSFDPVKEASNYVAHFKRTS